MMSQASRILFLLVIVAATTLAQDGATKGTTRVHWRVFSPASNSFSVDVPGQPSIHKLIPTKEDSEPSFEDVEWLEFFNGETMAKSVAIYDWSSEKIPVRIFEGEVDSSKRSSKTLEDEVLGFLLLFGGDDHNVSERRKFSISGHNACDVIYRNVHSNELYGRLLAVEMPGHVIVMVFNRAKGDLKYERRIFESFAIPSKRKTQ